MQFGMVAIEELAQIDFTLPQDAVLNAKVLSGKRVHQPKIYIGSSSWGHTSWVGNVYPPKTPATKFRNIYPNYFNAAELNATHYKIYSPEIISNWAASARGKDFKFCPKFPQSISHFSGFKDVEDLTNSFIESIAAFEELLGPAFLQVSEHFSPQKSDALLGYLETLPKDLDVFVELRHPEWFIRSEELFLPFQQMGKGLVITDTPGRRDCAHMCLTVPKFMLRFVSNQDHATTFLRVQAWAERIVSWIDNGLEEVYIFIHPNAEEVIPDLIEYWRLQFSKFNLQSSIQGETILDDSANAFKSKEVKVTQAKLF
jgi:hypothetical protein